MNLTPLQRIRRRLWLFFGSSYTHPDGIIDLDFEEKAGIDPTVDDEDTQRRKFESWYKRESIKQERWQYSLWGAVTGGVLVYWCFGESCAAEKVPRSLRELKPVNPGKIVAQIIW